MSTQVKEPSMVTKLHIKQYILNTPTILHMKTSPGKIFTESCQLPGPQAGLLIPVNFYIVGTQACSPTSNPAVLYPRKVRNRIV